MDSTDRPVSPWLDGAERPGRAPLDRDLTVNVAVVGAGIVGLTAALLLQRGGARVCVLEARQIGAGTTGNTTAKLSALHGLQYSRLAKVSPDAAAVYAQVNEEGIELVAGLVDELSIDCDFRRRPNYTFAERGESVGEIEDEVAAARAVGLAVEYVSQTPLPFEVAAAVRLANQAEFHPLRYLLALADELDADDRCIYEQTRVRALDGQVLETDAGVSVRAERFVIATHLPIFDQVGIFARAEPLGSYGVTARIPEGPPDGMFISSGSPSHSLRALPWGDQELLIVGGEGHRIGAGDPAESVAGLRAYALERFGAERFEHRWFAHDYVGEDGLPFVGPVSPFTDRALTATGMRKWGLAMGSRCAQLLADSILAGTPAWPSQLDSRRIPRAHRSLFALGKHGAETAYHLFGDRLRRESRKDLAPGEGRVVGSGLGQRALYRDENGATHELSARCTHLGCIVGWNEVARSWDCPCHGSRYDPLGAVLEGPATAPLERIRSDSD